MVLGGGPDGVAEVGRCVFDTIRRPERMEIFQALGSPAAVYEALPGFIEVFGPSFRMKTEMTGSVRVPDRDRDAGANEPFPELCAFGISLASTVPQLFGYPVAEIAQESCRCDGAPCCAALLALGSGRRRESQREPRRDARPSLGGQARRAPAHAGRARFW